MTRTLILSIITASLTLTSCALFQDNTKVTTVNSQTESPKSHNNSNNKKAVNKSNKSKKKKQKKDKTNAITAQHNAAKKHANPELINGEWTIIEVNAQKIEGEERPYLYFETEHNRFYGTNGCNTLNGDFSLEESNLTFSNVISTQKACHDAPYEYQINYALSQSVTHTVEQKGNEHYLSIHDTNGTKILVLRKHNMDYLNGHWQVIKINSKKCDDKEVQLVIDIPELKLHGNTGCNIVNGQLYIDTDKENSIQFQQLIATRRACPNQSQETSLLVALEETESAKYSEKDDIIIFYNNKGKEVLRLKRIEK